MNYISRLPIKVKLMLITMVTSIISLLLTCTIIILYDIHNSRIQLVNNLNAIGLLIADRSTAALTFQDSRLATENLSSLRVKSSVTAACILDERDSVFAKYSVAGSEPPDFSTFHEKKGHRFKNGQLFIFKPIILEGKQIGTVCICSRLEELYSRLKSISLLIFLILVFSTLIAFYISSRLHLLVSRPLLMLTDTAQTITRQCNYTLRAVRNSDDEIGILVGAFNEMLDRIESQNRDRERLNAELEERVVQRTAQLETANKELEAFTYSVSHDLRAPLRHISGYVDLLVKRCMQALPENGKHYLESIADSAHKMGTLIDDLLQFSRTGRMELRQSISDMNRQLREVIESINDENTGRIIEWSVASLPQVFCDEAMLRLVWYNLLSNSVKFTRTREKAMIEIGFRREKGELVFFVRDNGVGFNMQYAQKLFGVFQRLHPAEEFEGTGIGLANVRRIISRHEGLTWAEAEQDKGATFYFSLPDRMPYGSKEEP